MQTVTCVRREGPAAIYQYNAMSVRCVHERSDVPWDLYSQARTKVRVTLLDAAGHSTGRSMLVSTSSYDVAAMQALGATDARVVHNC